MKLLSKKEVEGFSDGQCFAGYFYDFGEHHFRIFQMIDSRSKDDACKVILRLDDIMDESYRGHTNWTHPKYWAYVSIFQLDEAEMEHVVLELI